MSKNNVDEFLSKKITIVNFIMCVLVVMLHSYNAERYTEIAAYKMVSGAEFFISRTLGNLAVPTFFLISAFLFFRDYGISEIVPKYIKRFKSLVIPYLTWNLLYLLAFAALISFPISNAFMDTKEIEISWRLVAESILFHKYNGVYWYMYNSIIFVIISPLIYLVMRKKTGIVLVAALLIISRWVGKIPANAYGVYVESLSYWCLGAWVALNKTEWINYRNRPRAFGAAGGALILFIVRFYLEFILPEGTISNFSLQMLLFLNVIMVWIAFDLFSMNAVFPWMGLTFFIYSFHPLLVDMVKKGIAALLPNSAAWAIINYLLSGLVGVLVSVCVAGILIRYCRPLWNVLNGGRIRK